MTDMRIRRRVPPNLLRLLLSLLGFVYRHSPTPLSRRSPSANLVMADVSPPAELHRFIELGKNLQPLDDDLIKGTGLPIFSKSGASEIQSAASNQPTINSLDSFDNKLVGQARNVEALVKQLEETTTILKEKESMILELEVTINQSKNSEWDDHVTLQAAADTAWTMHLLSVGCVSLAAKMQESESWGLSAFQVACRGV